MSDQQHSGDQPQDEQPELLTIEDRVSREVTLVWGRHELLTEEGTKDAVAVADLIYPTISKAVVQNPGERAKVGITPTRLVEQFFPDVPGPATWAEYDEQDRIVREKVYRKVKGEVFRVLDISPDGPVQGRLAANGGHVLCRTPSKGGREEMAYVTRNRICISEDNNAPAAKKAQGFINRAAALTALAAERVPEHGQWFSRQFNNDMKTGVETGKNKIQAALDRAEDEPDDE